jgi:hypothetical protein
MRQGDNSSNVLCDNRSEHVGWAEAPTLGTQHEKPRRRQNGRPTLWIGLAFTYDAGTVKQTIQTRTAEALNISWWHVGAEMQRRTGGLRRRSAGPPAGLGLVS